MRRKVPQEAIIAERMKRQEILDPVSSEEAYAQLFRNLQPVSPIAYTRPGSPPPCLEHRAGFNTFLSHGAYRGHKERQEHPRTLRIPIAMRVVRCEMM
jgi:hypothetical protein